MTASDPRETSTWAMVCAIFACFFAGGLYGWSALIAPLQAAFDVSAARTGLAFSLAIASFTIAVILVPVFSKSGASTRQISVLGCLGACCVGLAMKAQSYGMFLLWFSGGFGAMSGAIYIIALAIAATSPARHIATPVVVASFGAGGAIFGPLWHMLDAAGWGLNGLVFLMIGLLVSCVLAWCVDGRALPSGAPNVTAHVNQLNQPTNNMRRIGLIWLTFLFGAYAGLMVLGMAAKMMIASGLGVALVSATLASIALGNTLGRLSAALLSRNSGLEGCLVASFIASFAGTLMILLGGSDDTCLATGLILIAGGYGLVASTIPLITQSAFDPSDFQRRFAVIFTAWGVAGFCAPWIAGRLFDLTGNFDLALTTALASALLYGLTAYISFQEIRQR